MNKKSPNIKVAELRNTVVESMHKNLDLSNKLEHGVVRLIITLSSSGLLLTLALVEKLFPSLEGLSRLPDFLIISWILFFVSIIFGIVTEVNESIFFANQAREELVAVKWCDEKLAQGIFEAEFGADKQDGDIEASSLGWELICINSFVLAIIFLCFALLEKYPTIKAYETFFIITLFILLGVLNFHLLNKRKIIKKKERK